MSARASTAAVGPLDPLTVLDGVGPAKAAQFARVGIRCLGDLARLLPLGLDQPKGTVPLAQVSRHRGQVVRVRGRLAALVWTRLGPRRQSALRATLVHEGVRLDALFVGQPWVKKKLELGSEVELEGRVGGTRVAVLVGPRLAPKEPAPGELVPLYPRLEGISGTSVHALVRRAVELLGPTWRDDVPQSVLDRLELCTEGEAVGELSKPTSEAAFERARRRMALGVLMGFQARLFERNGSRAQSAQPSAALFPAEAAQRLAPELLAALPFEATGGQRRVLGEILADLSRGQPMRRLLQGDVGAGKTAVAILAALAVHRAGGQSVVMAPTGLLAEQHLEAARPLLERTGLRAERFVGPMGRRDKQRVVEQARAGELDVVFGTHALIFGTLPFPRLALAVIDEQHRFGVAQRRRLLERRSGVHALLMTATPIPRTLALSFYGDLDVSALREKPPGRRAVQTHRVAPARRGELIAWLDRHLAEGGRGFWVAPRVEPSEGGPGAEGLYAEFAAGPLRRHGVALAHGRQEPEVRRAALAALRRGDVRLLVGTTVLEVGVDVPEATVMVVEGAERFGLAQLHQLRGRVGRSERPSSCFLLADGHKAARLDVLVRTDDGFQIAEEDLRLRGMGDLLGLRQSGVNGEGLFGFEDDFALWSAARELVSEDAGLGARVLARLPPQESGL